ncbi:unnamed protein product [Choristocarpus tenellus]
MIRNVLIMASSGLVLFSKEFVNSLSQPRMVGSLLTAMLEFSVLTAGMQVSYVELTNVAVTLVANDKNKIFCALFHDREDGATFGRLIASEVLNSFSEVYASDLANAASSLNLKDFRPFQHRISDIVRKSVQPVLSNLGHIKGIARCVLVMETMQTFHTTEIDPLGLLANLQALSSLSIDIMAHAGDRCHTMTLESNSNSRILLWKIYKWTLVVAVNKAVNPAKYQKHIDEALEVLRKGEDKVY